MDGKVRKTHRLAYLLHFGEEPPAVLDHLCRVRACAQPLHLEAVSQAENVRRGDTGHHNRIKTECPAGHPYDESNTRVTKDGRRCCRECDRESARRYEAAHPERRSRPTGRKRTKG